MIKGKLIFDNFIRRKNIIFSDMETEVWNFTNESHKVINPTLPYGDYSFGVALYIVPFDFCTWSENLLYQIIE